MSRKLVGGMPCKQTNIHLERALAFDAQKRNTEEGRNQVKEWGRQTTDKSNPDSLVSLAPSPLAHPAKVLAI
jgi:hypothetical protein